MIIVLNVEKHPFIKVVVRYATQSQETLRSEWVLLAPDKVSHSQQK